MTYKEFASQINIEVDDLPDGCDMSREITIEDCIYLFNSLGRQIRYLQKQSPWHTGTPTEEGWYLVAFNYEDEEGVRYTTDYFKDGKWAFPMVRDISNLRAWQRIEPFEEAGE